MAETKTEHVVKITADTSDVSSKMTKADKELENLDKKGKNAGSTFSQLGKKLSEAFSSFGTSKATESMSQGMDLLQRKTERLQAQLKALGENKISTTEYSQLQSELTKAEQALSRYTAKQEKMSALGVTQESQSWKSVQYDINKTTSEIERLENAMSDMRNNDTAFQTAELLPTKEYEKAISLAEKAEKKLLSLYNRQEMMSISYKGMEDKMRSSKAFGNLQYQIEMAERELEAFESDVAHMEEDGTAYKYKIDTSDFGKLQSQIKQTEAQMSGMTDTANKTDSAVGNISSASSRAGSALSSLSSTGLSLAKSGLSALGSVAKSVGSTVLSLAKNIAGKLLSALKSIGSAAVNAGKKLLSAFSNTLLSPLKKVASGIANAAKSLLGLNKDAKSTTSIMKKLTGTFTSFTTMLISRFKRLAVSAIFEDLTDNFGRMATISDGFNSSVSSMIDSAKQLGAQLVAAVEPLITVAGPIISEFTDMLTGAADKLAQFTARMTGNSTYIKATKGVSDYKSSIDDTADSTEEATEATKEYQNTVLGFDQLNKMNGTSESETSNDVASITGIDDATLDKAQTQATELNEIADKIHDAISNKDFATAGEAVGEAATKAFSWLSDVAGWDLNADKITGVMQSIVDFINGLNIGLDGASIGADIADVLNSIVEAFHILVDPINGIDFHSIGTNIGEAIVSGCQNFHWATLGEDIVYGLQAAVQFVNGILEQDVGGALGVGLALAFAAAVDAFTPSYWSNLVINLWNNFISFLTNTFADASKFAEFGSKLAETINNIISGYSPETFSTAVTNVATSLGSALSTFIREADFAGFGSMLGDLMVTTFEGVVDFVNQVLEADLGGQLGAAISNWFSTAVDKLTPEKWSDLVLGLWNNFNSYLIETFGNPDSFNEFGTKLAEALNNVISGLDADTFWDGVLSMINSIYEALKGLIVNFNFEDFGRKFGEIINSLISKLDAGDFFETCFKLIMGIDKAILTAITTVDWWNILTKLVEVAWDLITAWVNALAEWYPYLIETIKNALWSIVEKIVEIIGSVGTVIKNAFKNLLSIGDSNSTSSSSKTASSSISHNANGGIIGDGQLFIANEGGTAELIGSDDNGNTAVVNNEQIISAVVSGVKQGVMQAIVNSGMTKQQESSGGDIVLQVDSEELARATYKGQKRWNKRTNAQVSFA